MKVLSYSLYGKDEKYLDGILKNLWKKHEYFYQDWKIWIYCDKYNFNKLTKVKIHSGFKCSLFNMGESDKGQGMCWRFLPTMNPTIDYVIMRDADSLINPREAAAVKDWIKSEKLAHVMRDHPHHFSYPIFGGMWGIKGGSLPLMDYWISEWPKWGERGDDLRLLAKYVWPIIKDDCLIHTIKGAGILFPEHDPYSNFVGARI